VGKHSGRQGKLELLLGAKDNDIANIKEKHKLQAVRP
jgi:hypothetical protein